MMAIIIEECHSIGYANISKYNKAIQGMHVWMAYAGFWPLQQWPKGKRVWISNTRVLLLSPAIKIKQRNVYQCCTERVIFRWTFCVSKCWLLMSMKKLKPTWFFSIRVPVIIQKRMLKNVLTFFKWPLGGLFTCNFPPWKTKNDKNPCSAFKHRINTVETNPV